MKTRLMIAAAAMLLALGAAPFSAYAEGANDEGAMTINDVPKVYSQTAVEQNLKEQRGIPWFNGTGKIDQIVENSYVVNDMTLVGTNVDFRSEASGQPLPSSSFKPGVKVGYVLDSNNTLKSLWLLKEQ